MRTPLVIFLVFVAATLGSLAPPARAQTVPVGWPDRNHLIGMVTDVVGPAGDPTSFSLQLGNLSAEVVTVPATRFVARSLEAQVEKLVVGDYALVVIRHTKAGLTAARITYDVEPFGPLHAFNGAITWVSPDQMRFRLRLDTGRVVPLRVRPQTRFELDGHVADTLPTLLKGQTVQVLALQYNGLDAFEINVTRSGPALLSAPR
jgi:hypothetical protein